MDRDIFLFWLCLLSAACGEQARTICDDRDGDGFGAGCGRGPDCDETNPLLALDCTDSGVTLGECELEPAAQGCPCLSGERMSCFDAPAELEGVGVCRAGRASCADGRFSACEGAILPGLERCNGDDDDCDGFVDEGVESPCGGCNDECQGGVWGSPAAPFEVSEPLALTAAGELTLAWQPSAAKVLWVANTDEGSVSKIDAQTAREVARYRTRGGYPIQVAVDHRGDAFVLDGTFGGQAHLTKIASESARCLDRNGDGLHTSAGPEQVLPVGQDECVSIDAPLLAADEPRALAVDGALAPDATRAGDVWLACAGSQQLLQLAGDSAEELARYDIRRHELQPHASAFDPFGRLWLIARDGKVLRFDPLEPEAGETMLVPYPCYSLDALGLDAQGRLLLSGFGCERMFSYDPQRSQWRSAQMPDLLSPRGVVAGIDASWISYSSGQIARLKRESLQPEAAVSLVSEGLRPFETFALSLDSFGQIWAISTQGGRDGVGLATRFDPKEGKVSAQVPVGRGPRAGGDLSGSASGGEFAKSGRASHVFGGCGREGRELDAVSQARTEWLNLRAATLLGAGAKLEISVRHAASIDQLPDATYKVIAELPRDTAPFPLSLPAGGAIEVALDLESLHAIGAPRVARVGVEWSCPGPE